MSETKQAAAAPELGLIRGVVRCYQDLTALTSKHVRSLGLGPAEFDVLCTLGNTDGLTFKDLSERTLIYKTTLTSVVDRLEEKGLTHRKACSEDRRCIFVCLTDAGDALFQQVFPAHVDYLRQRMADLQPEQMRELLQSLETLRALLR